MTLNKTQKNTIGAVVFVVVATIVYLLTLKKKGTLTSPLQYKARVNTQSYLTVRDESYEYGWKPDLSRSVKTFKAGDSIGVATGYYYSTTNRKWVVFEQPFIFGSTVFVSILEDNLVVIQ